MTKPKVAFFDFTGCEGCQLQKINCEDELIDILNAYEIVNFREASSVRRDDYEIAFAEGSISNSAQEEMIKKIREKAKILVALGACAATGGLNILKNFQDIEEVRHYVYGDKAHYFDTIPVKPIDKVVKVDYYVHGCPMDKGDFIRTVKAILLGKKPALPKYPVCVECKMKEIECRFDYGEVCLGPITRAGCGARCPSNGFYCFGCRGLVDNPAANAEKEVLAKNNLTPEEIVLKFRLFYGYSEVSK